MAEKLQGQLIEDRVLVPENDSARELQQKSSFGKLMKSGDLHLGLLEALYLVEKGKMVVKDGRGQELGTSRFFKRARKHEAHLFKRYTVFKDLRERGYVVKTALKFGADFRVYDRGVKPGEDHAKWIVYPVTEGETFTWQEFAAKNRVAHSTRKKLMIGIVDDEGGVTYYQISWMRP